VRRRAATARRRGAGGLEPGARPVAACRIERRGAARSRRQCACHALPGHWLDLGAALLDKDCNLPEVKDRPRPSLPAALRVNVEPAVTTAKGGDWLVLRVHFVNPSEAPVELVIERDQSFGDFFGEGFEIGHGDLSGVGVAHGHLGAAKSKKPAAPAPPRPPERTTPGFAVVDVRDAKGRNTEMPTGAFGMLGLLAARHVDQTRITVEPHAEAIGTVVWAAKGYDPDKNYFPKPKAGKGKSRDSEGRMAPAPEPLGPGDYRFDVELPVVASGDARARLPVKLHVTK
jgi:hypothetical protein